jgi:hypothetical protein
VTGPDDLKVDFTLVMKGYDFETVWKERRVFRVETAEVQTARLTHIVASKQAAGRQKDQLFLATHKDALEQLLKKKNSSRPSRDQRGRRPPPVEICCRLPSSGYRST